MNNIYEQYIFLLPNKNNIWNYICKVQHPSTFCSLSTFKRNIRNTYKNLLGTVFDIEMPCTWSLVRDCPCHRS